MDNLCKLTSDKESAILINTMSSSTAEFIILDTETTGLNPELGDALVEIAGQRIRGTTVIDQFCQVINPGIPCANGAAWVHGMSEEYIFRNGKPIKDVLPAFINFCGQTTLVGHNIIKFDLEFINNHLRQLGMQPMANPVIDTLHLARKKLALRSYKLGDLAHHFKVEYSDAHRALRDVEITREIFYHLAGYKNSGSLF